MYTTDGDDDHGGDRGGGGPGEEGCSELSGRLADVVEAVERVAGRFLALTEETPEVAGASGGELGAALVALHRQQQRLAAGVAHLAARFDRSGAWAYSGLRTAKGWLGHRCGVSQKEAEDLVDLGRALRKLPVLDAALSAGELSVAHARKLMAVHRQDRFQKAFEADQELLVGYARTMAWRPFAHAVEHWKYCADPDGAEQQAADDEAARYVALTGGLRGTGLLDGELTPVGRETVTNALERIHDELFRSEWQELHDELGRDPNLGDLRRTKGQRMHDALVEMAVRACSVPADAKRPEPLVSVFVGLDSLNRACELSSGRFVTPGTISPLLDRARMERIVWDSKARVIEVGEARSFRGAQRRALLARDRQCQWPGCHVPGKWCQTDHIQPVSRDGTTTLANGQLLCGYHNRRKSNAPPQAA